MSIYKTVTVKIFWTKILLILTWDLTEGRDSKLRYFNSYINKKSTENFSPLQSVMRFYKEDGEESIIDYR